MQYLQATYISTGTYLLHSFCRDFSRSLTAHPIAPLPPEFQEATPLAAARKAGDTAQFRKMRFSRNLLSETLGRWIKSSPNRRGSDIAEPNDHRLATPGRAQAPRT